MNSFQELKLSPLLMRAIEDLGYEKPSQIQAEALPILLGEPTDFIGLAATGTGKTAAFALPLLERIDTTVRGVQGLILCPTRELALQVAGQINLLGKHLGIKALPVYGGSSYGDQINGLKRGAMIVVGTPGRVVDHIERGTLDLSNIETVILDEADEMISMGFKEDLETILSKTPRETSNIWLFSATMSSEVRRVADEYLTNPELVQVNRTEMLPDTIEQLYYKVHEGDKPEILCKLIEAADDFYGLVFCQTKALVADLTQYLKTRGYRVDCLHGDMEQDARERTMKSFRDRKVTLLICTDVASRGLDVKDITHVINYSLPRELDNYVHRIGRTARSGKKGTAMSLVTPSHKILISRIERMTKSRMFEGRIPTRRELGAKKVAGALTRFLDQPFHTRVLEILGSDDSWKQALTGMSPEEVASRFITAMYEEVFADRDSSDSRDSRESRGPAREAVRVAPGVNKEKIRVSSPAASRAGVRVSPVAPLSGESKAPVQKAPVQKVEDAAAPMSSSAHTMDSIYAAAGSSEAAPVKATPAQEASVKEAPAADAVATNGPLLTAATLLELEPTPAKAARTAKRKKAAAAAAAATESTPAEMVTEERPPSLVASVAAPVKRRSAAPMVAPLSEPVAPRAFSDEKPRWERKPYGSKSEGGYGSKREGGYAAKREGGYGTKRESGGYGVKREGGFAVKREGSSFGVKTEGGYGAKREGGFAGKREGGFAAKREGGYGAKREGGYGAKRGSYGSYVPKAKSGWVGGKPKAPAFGDDIGLGRAPQDRPTPWKTGIKKPSAPTSSATKSTWSKDKPLVRRRPA